MASALHEHNKSSRRCGKTCRRRIHSNPSRPISCAHDESLKLIRIWMKKECGFKNKLVPAVFTKTGRGLMTKKSIRPGEVIVSLPHRLLITTQTVLESDIGNHIKRWQPKLTPQQCLTVFLIWEKHKQSESPWFPYINMLPVIFTSPGYFSSTELSFLPKPFRLKTNEVLEKLNISYREVEHFSKHHWREFYDILTYDVYMWAWYVVNSRSVYYESNVSEYLSTEEPDNIALAPYLDLLNHSSQANVKAGFNSVTNCYEIITYDVYKPYQEVFISYGCHSNQKLFIEYGFYVPDNCNDVFEISYDDVLNTCEHFCVKNKEKKLDLLKHHDLLKNLVCTLDGLSWKTMTVFKTLAMEWRHLDKWNQIYTESDIFYELLPIVKSMIKYILQPYLDDNIELMKQLQIQKDKADLNPVHVEIIQQLLKIENSILTATLSIDKWNQIYTESDIFNELLPIVKSMIKYILQPYLDDNIELIKQLQIQKDKADLNPVHVVIIQQLLKIENSILTATLSM